MEKLIIQGGYLLKGEITVSGNKNEALPAIAACLITDEPVILRNVPRIRDVETMLKIMKSLGVQIREIRKNELELSAENITNKKLDEKLFTDLRASILTTGPLLTRFNNILLPLPGGDVIGHRRLDTHFLAFENLGVRVSKKGKKYLLEKAELVGSNIFLDEQSVTATENAIMAAVLSKGKTILRNAACEPHVRGLSNMLNSMGAKIKGIGTNILEIEGVDRLSGTDYTIGTDYIEAGGYIILAAVTNSEITIRGVNPNDFFSVKNTLRKLGIEYMINGNEILVKSGQILEVIPDISGDIPKIDDGTWPAFPSDLMSSTIVAATQAKGTLLFFEKMYDGRMFFVDHLISMGAKIVLCDPHRIVVIGPSQLYGSEVQSPDIRAGMALVIAALCAKGKSVIYNIKQIDRGYENLEEKLQKLGAKIVRIKE